MELRCIRWALLLLLLTIVTTEGLRDHASRVDKSFAVRARSSFRPGSKSSTSSEPTTSSPDSAGPKTSRKGSGTRRPSWSRSAAQATTTKPTTAKTRGDSAIQESSGKSKSPQKSTRMRFVPRKMLPKTSSLEPEVKSDSSNKDRRYLPEGKSDNARTGRAQEHVEGIEAPKISDGPRESVRKFGRLRPKLGDSGPSIFTEESDGARSRTGRKAPSPESNVSRRNSRHDTTEFRKKMAEARNKPDITASGSESIRINIPLNFEDSKRAESTDGLSTESSRRPTNSRYKSRGRQPVEDKRRETEVTTRAAPRRGGGTPRGGESSTEGARIRGRFQDARKSTNNAAEISSTTPPTDSRRRNHNLKPTPRAPDASRSSSGSRVSETKAPVPESRKPNKARGRYRQDTSSTAGSPDPTLSAAAPRGFFIPENVGSSTRAYEELVRVTTSQPTITSSSTSFRALSESTTAAPADLENNRREGNAESRSQQNNGLRRRASKEDFFNHGLGFRGRRPPFPGVDEVPAMVTTPTTPATVIVTTPRPDNVARGNPGWTLRRRPGHWNDGPASGPSANPAESPITIEQQRTTPATSTTTTTTPSSTTKAGRRGNKTFSKPSGGSGNKASDQADENDNYPPDFKARLAQLQKSSGGPRISPDASKMTSAEIFAARSKMKLENARKLIKPELLIDETNARQVILDPAEIDQKPSDSEVEEDQKHYKVTRKTSEPTEKPQSGQKSIAKSDWKPAKLRKTFKESQTRTSRYKMDLYTVKPKISSTTSKSFTEKRIVGENDVEHVTYSPRVNRYQELKYKFVPKPRENKLRGPKPSHDVGVEADQSILTTKSPLLEKPRKIFTPRKNDKSNIEDIKAVALKLRKTLENMEKSQTSRPPRRSDSSEGSTTLLTTMRTVKSFSFSTRLVKTEEGESATSSTMKMIDDEITTAFIPTSTSSSFVTEIVTRNPLENEVTTSSSAASAVNTPSSSASPILDTINEIENSSATITSSTTSTTPTESSIKGTFSSEVAEYQGATSEPVTSRVDYKPRVAALTNDIRDGSPVFVVYPSATEKPLSIAITPKMNRYHATTKPSEVGQQSVMQTPVISVKVSNSNLSDGIEGNSNIFSPVKSAAILETGNSTILETLRSTVAPLLGTLGAKSPVFAGVYKNTNSVNSVPRVTPSGAPPRFSARYKGAEVIISRPTPATNSIENNDAESQIQVSSPGEPKVLTFYHAVESVNINNEQTDVRELLQHGRAARVENATGSDPHGTNSSNSELPIIKVTNNPLSIENVTTVTPDTIKPSDSTSIIENAQEQNQSPDNNEIQSVTDLTDFPTVLSTLVATQSSLSTSTDMITEVSVSISNNLDQNSLFTTTSRPPSSGEPSLETRSEMSTSPQTLITEPTNSTEMPPTPFVSLDSTEISISTTETSQHNETVEVENSREPKKLEDTHSEHTEVSNSLLDITYSPSNKETTQPTILEIQVGQEPLRTTKLEILAQVKRTDSSGVNDKLNDDAENTTKKLEVLAMFGIPRENQTSSVEELMIQSVPTLKAESITETEITTESVTAVNIDNPSETRGETEIATSADSSAITSDLETRSNEEFGTTQSADVITTINNENITDLNHTENIMDIEIQFYNSMNETVPAGTEKLIPMKDLFSNKEFQASFKKFLYSVINSKKNITHNNSFDDNFMAELNKVAERLSVNKCSINETQSSLRVDENRVNSSTDELPQLSGSFLDDKNKIPPVTNDSTVETNNDSSIDAPMSSIATTSTHPEKLTDVMNTDSNTEKYLPNSYLFTKTNNKIAETTTFIPILTDVYLNDSGTKTTNINSLYAPYINRMLQIFAKLLDEKTLSELPIDSQIQKLDSLIPASTEQLPVVEDLTKLAPLDDSTNSVSTTVSIETEIPLDPTTISPTLFTRFQDSSPATAQRTAGTNKQTITTLNPIIKYPSSSEFSSTTVNTNDIPTNNQQPTIPAKTTTQKEKNWSYTPRSTFSSRNAISSSKLTPEGLTTTTSTTSTTTTTTTTIATAITATTAESVTTQQPKTSSYIGRFGTSRPTPAPKSGSTSSTTAPLRDYLIYGIYPNKTIVRKRPEDNLIDPRNVDSPYVIFGIYPDGKLVRKFPNGTVIPDPPRNSVEVVYSPNTTTNKPGPLDSQANKQSIRNWNTEFFNNSPDADVNTQKAFYIPNEVDNALGFGGPTSFEIPIGSVRSGTIKEMTTTTKTVMESNQQQNGQQRIVQERSRDKTSKTNESEGQRSSTSIEQEKIINYWANSQPNPKPTILSVNVNSAATAIKEGSPSSSVGLDILPEGQNDAVVTAPPGFPWKDPLDQIFGITTVIPSSTVSVTTNTIEDSNARIAGRPENNLVEIISPVTNTINSLIKTPTLATTTTTKPVSTTEISTTPATPITTTQPSTPPPTPPTTSTTSTTTIRTITTTQPITTSTTRQSTSSNSPSTYMNPIATNQNAFGTTFDDLAFLNALLEKPSPNEGTPKTLTEVEQMLANKILALALGRPLTDGGPTRSPKAIQQSNVSPNSLSNSKGVMSAPLSPNFAGSSSQPIVVDVSTTRRPPTTPTASFTWKPLRTFDFDDSSTTLTTPSSTTTTPKRRTTSTTTTSSTTVTATSRRATTTPRTTVTATSRRATTTSTTPSTTTTVTTRRTTTPVVITARPVNTRRPKPTTQAPQPAGPLAFAANFLQTLLGRNPFAPVTTQRPVVVRRPVTTPRRSVPTTITATTITTKTTASTPTAAPSTPTAAPSTPAVFIVQAESSHTPRSIQIANSVTDPPNNQNPTIVNNIGVGEKLIGTTSKTPISTTTFSPEDDAKFLQALLKHVRETGGTDGNNPSSSPKPALDGDDEAFLRALLSSQSKIQPLSTAGGSDQHDAALLASFLKEQGIEPPMPPNLLTQQLYQNSLGKTTASTTRQPTTTRTTTRRTHRRPPSSTYPPPLFSNFPFSASGGGDFFGQGEGRSQIVNVAIGMTQAFGRFLGAAITGAAQQFQSFMRNGTRLS